MRYHENDAGQATHRVKKMKSGREGKETRRQSREREGG